MLFASVGLSEGFYEAALNSLFCFREREIPVPSFFNDAELYVDIWICPAAVSGLITASESFFLA